MNRLQHKAVALVTIFLAILIPMALPIKISQWFEKRGARGLAVLSAIMCFGGGIFVGAFLLHMAPEGDELIQKTINKPKDIGYPISFLIIGGGFFFMMFLERATLEFQRWHQQRQGNQVASASEANGAEMAKKGMPEVAENGGVELKSAVYINSAYNGDAVDAGAKDANIAVVDPSKDLSHGYAHAHAHAHGHAHEAGREHDPHGPHSHLDAADMRGSLARAVVLLLALSLDCIFEGLSLGIQSTISGVWRLVIAILSHEVPISFTLGISLMKHTSPRRTLYLALFYALTNPIGIGIGMAISETGRAGPNLDVVQGVLTCFTGGVFLFVAFFEILKTEITHDSPFLNVIMAFVGFGVFAGLMVIHEMTHEHDHDHSEGANGTSHSLFAYLDEVY